LTAFAIVGPVLRRWIRRAAPAGGLATAAAVLVMAAGALWVKAVADDHVHSVAAVREAPVAIVLGAQVYAGDVPSPFLAARLEIARQLYATGKVRAILVSGDHAEWAYNEPGSMFEWLVRHGVPAGRVVLDHAGFDTYDTCARARQIFGVHKAVVVTQSYHIERAVALCRTLGIDADGVGDDTVRAYRQVWLSCAGRERMAVVKALGDTLSGRDPVYLGRYESSVDDALR
jgi:vancomycin permeability regulator SanA